MIIAAPSGSVGHCGVVPGHDPRSADQFICGVNQCVARLSKPTLRPGVRSSSVTCPRCGSRYAFYLSSSGKNEAHYFAGPTEFGDLSSSGWGSGPADRGVGTVGRQPQARPLRALPRSGWKAQLPLWRPKASLGMAVRNRLNEWHWVVKHRVFRQSPMHHFHTEEDRRDHPRPGGYWPSNN